ncbi:MAG: magnesium chelatase ATPase subunit D, partial [Rhodobacteraceae bacterium]|nr:magnesium chelatase ATPase subunit D [Paracoccaceae bacterium]
MSTAARWERMRLALSLLAVDPAGLGGLWVRARAGPVRDALVAALPEALAPLPLRRVPPGIDDDQLFGGIDLTATLAAGRVVRSTGLLGAGPVAMVMPMAERASRGLAARLAAALDDGPGHVLVALDEGAEDDEALAPGLSERLALHLDLSDLAWHGRRPVAPDATAILGARSALGLVEIPQAVLEDLTRLAARLGVVSLRAPSLALACARASAALAGRGHPVEEDLRIALDLVLAPRATMLPAPAPEEQPENEAPPPDEAPPPPEEDGTDDDRPAPPEAEPEPEEADEASGPLSDIPDEILLEAVRA